MSKTKKNSLKEVVSILNRNREKLDKFKVKHLELFGSFAREEQTVNSDIDLIVEFTEGVGYFHFFELRDFLEKILKRKVDLTTKNALHPRYREQIEKELIRAA